MMKFEFQFLILFSLSIATAASFANPDVGATSGVVSTASQNKVEIAPNVSSTPLREAPSLKVEVSCNDCAVSESVPDLILKGYLGEAGKQKVVLSQSEAATLTIVEYRQRAPGLRIMTGVFSGKDRIKAVLKFKGGTLDVDSSYADSMHGMNATATQLGERALKSITSGGSVTDQTIREEQARVERGY
jgi:hypothetical protein